MSLIQNGNVVMFATTDAAGNYSLSNVPGGTYSVAFTKGNYLRGLLSNYALANGVTVTVNASLTPEISAHKLGNGNTDVSRHWQVHNPLNSSVNYVWRDRDSSTSGSGVATPGDSAFDTPKVINQIVLFVNGNSVQPESTTIVAPPVTGGSVSGVVTNMSGTPLPNVTVTATDPMQVVGGATSTLSDGSYQIPNLSPNTYNLTFALNGYQTAVRTVVVNSGTNTPLNVVLVLIPVATVGVTVVENGDGAPLPNVSVTITYASGQTSGPLSTDGNGGCVFQFQPVGVSAVISAVLNDGSGRTASVSVAGGFSSGPNPVIVGVNPIPRGSISGVVSSNSMPPAGLGGVQVSLNDPVSGAGVGSATTAQDGSYTIPNIVTGQYNMSFLLHGYNPVNLTGVTVNDGVVTTENVTLTPIAPPPTADVNLTVISAATGLPIPGVSVQITYSDGTASAAHITDGNGFTSFQNQEVGVNAFVVGTLSSGSLTLGTTGSFISGGFVPGVNPVQLLMASGSISGTVTDSSTMAGLGAVQITVFDASNALQMSALSQADGSYVVAGLTPGIYSVTFSKAGYQTFTATNVAVISGGTATQNAALTAVAPVNPSDATVTVSVTYLGVASGGATIVIDYGINNPPWGPTVGQTDPNSGIVTFTNQLVGVPATVSAVLSDGTTVFPTQTVQGFQSGSTSTANFLSFSF